MNVRPPNFLQTALDGAGGRVALLIGNGIHQFNAKSTGNDWSAMIQSLAAYYGLQGPKNATSLALTELYDLIALRMPMDVKPNSLQEQFCAGMDDWKVAEHHRRIANWAINHKSPILTTNFDHVLSDAAGAKLRSMFELRGSIKAPTDYYPWEKYFGQRLIPHPCADFGIWHVNGLLHHTRSIRLGLTDYMGSVSRARPWLHGSKENRLFSEKNTHEWRGRNTWLHIVFNMPLLIFGLGLGTEEVLLRWLLIERAKYFRQFPNRSKPAWYVYPVTENSPDQISKYFFLKSIGIKPISTEDYESIYGHGIWSD